MTRLSGHILTPQGFVAGSIEFTEDGRVAGVEGSPVAAQAVRDSTQPLVLPGFIDLHVHGGGGRDIMEGGDAAARVAELHASHGTTALLATTMTAPMADLETAFAGLQSACAGRARSAARVLGIHLEGPYINAGKLGAQPNFARPVEFAELQRLNEMAPIRLITLAPEIPGNMEAIESLIASGYRVQLGHTLGSYEDGVNAMSRGAGGFTHLFNAMTGLHHREPGMVGAALAHAQYSEIIPDLLHAHPGAIRVALRAIPCLYCVTDSTAASGMPDGEYRLGRHKVTKCLGGVRLADGTLAGSTLTMDQALRNLVDVLGLDLPDASRRVSTHAADYIGATDRGRLGPGAWADAVVLDRDLKLMDVYVEGVSIELA
ncbi:N-acetylglucosamine-6-phosphate deacetylase [Piscinibacter sp.]|jgi:N-acetylglucosamine-6-phosphate deacetylase|uniref:N-acetylglucosamine-6-phosphate deacetylase n=1 Tax=Piscinibacter sp. TaxID=1903157 RepID=UPI0035596814